MDQMDHMLFGAGLLDDAMIESLIDLALTADAAGGGAQAQGLGPYEYPQPGRGGKPVPSDGGGVGDVARPPVCAPAE
jgi:hypothetical protein